MFSSCKFLFRICCCCCCLGLSKSCPRINAGLLGSRQEQETQIYRNRPSLGWVVPFPWSFKWWFIGCESNVSCFLKQVVRNNVCLLIGFFESKLQYSKCTTRHIKCSYTTGQHLCKIISKNHRRLLHRTTLGEQCDHRFIVLGLGRHP